MLRCVGATERALRAAAVAAVEGVVASAGGAITALQLSNYLLAKYEAEDQIANLRPHLTTDVVAY